MIKAVLIRIEISRAGLHSHSKARTMPGKVKVIVDDRKNESEETMGAHPTTFLNTPNNPGQALQVETAASRGVGSSPDCLATLRNLRTPLATPFIAFFF